MSTPTTPDTMLEAVNLMLSAIGQAQVMSLATEDTNEETQKAVTALGETAREVQLRGWHFNTEKDFPINPDQDDGSITLPDNAGVCVLSPRSYVMDLAQRGNRMYDVKNHTFNVLSNYPGTSAVYVNLTLLFSFEDIPPPIRWYITAYAGRKFATGRAPDTGTYKFTKEVEDTAYAEAKTYDDASRGTTLADENPHFARMRRR